MNRIPHDKLSLQKKKFIRENSELYDDITLFIRKYHNNGRDITFKEMLYLYHYSIKKEVKCKNCNIASVRFKSFNKGYVSCCSNKCSGELRKSLSQEEKDRTNRKRIETNLKKYGVSNVAQNSIIKEKIKSTNIDKYGTYFPLFNDEIKEKKNVTNLKNWNGHPLSNKEKIIERSLARKITMRSNWERDIINILDIYSDNLSVIKIDENKNIKLECSECGLVDSYTSSFIKQRHSLNTSLCKGCNPLYTIHNNKDKLVLEKYSKLKLNNIVLKDYSKNNFTCSHVDEGHDFTISRKMLYDRIRDKSSVICTVCNPYSSSCSSHELEIQKWLINLNIDFIENDRKILGGKELDIYIPKLNLAIEFNGLYWHSEYFKDDNYHLNKTIECGKKGVELIHIYEDDWKFKKDIIKSIVRNRLGIIGKKIFGRKCVVKEVKSNVVREFLDENHIQGFSKSTYKLGLYYNEELVSLMTFGYRKTNTVKEFELIRFTNKLDTIVIGAGSKLFKYFINNYSDIIDSDYILSYADVSLFSGKLYKELGFDYIHTSKPNYFWVVNDIREHRWKYNKQKLIKEGYDKNKTEVEIMHERGAYRIWGCGQKRYEYKLK